MNYMKKDLYSPRSIYKNDLLCSEKLIVKRSELHRWGVFAKEDIKKYEILEEFPYFAVPLEEIKESSSCLPYSYNLNDEISIIGMGFCGLYNHSFDANVDYEIDKVNEVMRHYALRDINMGEELTLNYGEENVQDFCE